MSTTSKDMPRVNEINIQMIPEKLHEQIFPKVDTTGTFLCTINHASALNTYILHFPVSLTVITVQIYEFYIVYSPKYFIKDYFNS